MFETFGMTKREQDEAKMFYDIWLHNPEGAELTGPLHVEDYWCPDAQYPRRLGVRPGAFLGWLYLKVTGHHFDTARVDPTTGKLCYIYR